jgi:antitoxin component YwqK of YwqJK toxin-antitoxin module
MRRTSCFLLLLFFVINATAQKIEKFYDFAWKPSQPVAARFYVLIEKVDSVWQRKDYFIKERSLQMKGSYLDSACKIAHGSFKYYHANGKLQYEGDCVHGKKEGLWLSYHANGLMSDSTVYANDKPIGTSLAWHSNGYISDSAVYNQDGSGIKVSWFDNGVPASAGRYAAGYKQNGKWQYFHKNGQKSAVEVYSNGVLINKEYFSEDGASIRDTTNKDRQASFKGGKDAWQQFILKQLYFPDQYKIVNADKIVVVVDAVIDEDGKLTDVEVAVPFHPDFDRIAVNALKKSPKWTPAILHNRRVKYKIRQAVFFAQESN